MIRTFEPAHPDREVASVPVTGPEQVGKLLDAAARAQPGWAASGPERCTALEALATRLEARAGEAAELLAREVGKPITEARGEAARAVAIVRYYSRLALDPDGETYPSPDGRSRLSSRRDPLGVVLAICPWNFPLAIPLWKAAPALAFGNAVLVKPAHAAAGTAALLAECAAEALPGGVLAIAAVPGERMGGLLDDERVAAATITGSTQAGMEVIARMARRAAPCQAEMGGHNPAIVLEDADPEAAATAIVSGAFGYAGQKCTATRRAIAVGSVRGPLLEAISAAAAELRVGDPLEEETVAGPLIDAAAVAAFEQAVADGLGDGGELVATAPTPMGPGHFVAPSIIALDDPGARINQEETFGPLLTLMRAADPEDALRIANSTRYGLVGAVHSRDSGCAVALAERLACGMVRVNAATPGVDYYAPFGGSGRSGYGPREQGHSAREFFTRQRTLLVAPAGQAG
jgi:aldehyde dehydrogenase (NAD+)